MENTIKTKTKTAKKFDTKKLTVLAMFTALGYICLFVCRFKVQFLSLEFKDIFITMAAFAYGPVAGVFVSLTEALLELFTLSDTGLYGFVMNFAGSASFAFTAGIIYKYKKNIFGAVLGLVSAIVVMTSIMIIMNILVTPYYMKCDTAAVYQLIPTLLLPFNLIKGLINSALTLLLYKPVTQAMRAIKILPSSSHNLKFDRNTIIVTVLALIMVITSVVVLFNYLNANWSIGK
ncbi:MAG: ECF transporter S component [Hominimerdicola sp.]